MIDYYALPSSFPNFAKADLIKDPYTRIQFLEDSFAKDIDSKKFIPYIQLHEHESLLFTDINIVHSILSLNNPNTSFSDLEKVLKEFKNPELINGGNSTAPSKRIKKLYPDYQKSVDAIRILKKIGLANLRNSCCHFHGWLVSLEKLHVI